MKILIVIPVYNEEIILKQNVLKIFNFCKKNLKIDWQIIIADNKSTDKTSEIGKSFDQNYSQITYFYVDQKGKGAAIFAGWKNFEADVYCFMDADLATDLLALPELISGIQEGNDVVIGSRRHPQSKVERLFVRKVFSLGYRLIAKVLLGLKIMDLPCGFKAINSKIKVDILPQIKNKEWFFDSELVILAEKKRYKVKEIPVVWKDLREGGDKSKVQAISLSLAYFKQLMALRKRLQQK